METSPKVKQPRNYEREDNNNRRCNCNRGSFCFQCILEWLTKIIDPIFYAPMAPTLQAFQMCFRIHKWIRTTVGAFEKQHWVAKSRTSLFSVRTLQIPVMGLDEYAGT